MLMLKTIIIIGLLVLNKVQTEEETPAGISISGTETEETTEIQEELNHNDDSPTIKIEISKDSFRNGDSKLSKTDTDSDEQSRTTKFDHPRLHSEVTEVSVHEVNSREGNDIEFQERFGTDNDKSDNSSKEDETFPVAHLVNTAGPNDGNADNSRNHEEVGLESGEIDKIDKTQPQSEESEVRSGQNVMLDIKGRNGQLFDSLEAVKAISPEDVRSYGGLKAMDNPVLHRRLSDTIFPQYFRDLSRISYPHSAGVHRFPSARFPYFGRLTSAELINSGRPDAFRNTRRTASNIPSNTATEPEVESRHLEDYTDPNNNAYPYTPDLGGNQISIPNPQIANPQQKFFGQANHQLLPQYSPYSNENVQPLFYAGNYPYGVHTRFL